MKLLGTLVAFGLVTLTAYVLGLRVQWPTHFPNTETQSANQLPPEVQTPVPELHTVTSEPVVSVAQASELQPIEPLPEVVNKPLSTPAPQAVPSSAAVAVPMLPPPAAIEANKKTTEVAVAEPLQSTTQTNQDAPLTPPAQAYVFWQPFSTRSSAEGFASALTQRSAVPVEVIEDHEGEQRRYRVVLPYQDEEQRVQRLARLAATTRLEIR